MPFELTFLVLKCQNRKVSCCAPMQDFPNLSGLSSFYILTGGVRILGCLGDTGVRILMRLMGLVLSALAVQFVINGLGDLLPDLVKHEGFGTGS